MERNTFNPLFFIKRKQLLKNGEAPIYLRITVNGERRQMSVNRSVDPKLWNQDKGLMKGNSNSANDLNDDLEHWRQKIYKCKRILEDENLHVTAQAIIEIFQGNTK